MFFRAVFGNSALVVEYCCQSAAVMVTLLATMLGSCSRGESRGMDSSVDTLSVDSLSVDSLPAEKNMSDYVLSTPDTVYPSAAAVDYKIEVCDSTSGELGDLSDPYRRSGSILTFRGDRMRDARFGARLDSIPTRIEVDWSFTTSNGSTTAKYGPWGGGTGWTGQPLYIDWEADADAERGGAYGDKRGAKRGRGLLGRPKESTREIIVGSLSGEVYFIDYDSGKPSREPVNVVNPVKGTISLDPMFNGNLYVGQGVPSDDMPIQSLVVDLSSHRITHRNHPDPKAWRGWHAFDSSPVRAGDFLFWPGENGTLYKFRPDRGTLRLHSAMRYRVGGRAPGMEASMAVYGNYGYTADNAGNVMCVNLATMRPVWLYQLPDDTDSSPVLAIEDGRLFLYIGCEVERPGVDHARYVKLDALTGEEIWRNDTPAQRADVGEKHFDGGFYSTALLGSADCAGLLFVNVVNNTRGQNGSFMAIDRATGATRYTVPLKCYAWSSPVGYTTRDGELVVMTADCAGRVYLIVCSTCEILAVTLVGSNFESSPIAIGKTGCIGSRGNRIFRLALR